MNEHPNPEEAVESGKDHLRAASGDLNFEDIQVALHGWRRRACE